MKTKLKPTHIIIGITMAGAWLLPKAAPIITQHLAPATASTTIAAQPTTTAVTPAAARTLPLITETATVASTQQAPTTIDPQTIKTLFAGSKTTTNAAEAIEKPKPIDYFSLLKQHMQLDGTTNNGAIINGTYYTIGDEIGTYAYPRGPNTEITIAPKLKATTETTAIIQEAGTGKRTITIHLADKN